MSNSAKKMMVLSVAVALVGGYIAYDSYSQKKATENKEQKALIVTMKPDQIQFVAFKNEYGQINLERLSDGWHLVAPIKDFAKPSAIDDFIEGLVTEKMTEVAVEGGKIDFSAFGLDEPKAAIQLKDNLGRSKFIAIGRAKNFQGDSFLRIDQDQRVLIASSTWFAKAEKKLEDFRDRRLMRPSVSSVLKLQIQTPTERFLLMPKASSVAGEPSQWISAQHPDWKLDQNKVREYLRQLNLYEAIEIVAESPPRSDEMKKWGLAKPYLVLSAELKDNQMWTAHFAAGADKVHRAHISIPEMTMKISPTESDRLAKTSEDLFRDRNEPVQFDRTHVHQVHITLGAKKIDLRLENDQWKSAAGTLDVIAFEALMKELSSLAIAQFSTPQDPHLNKQIVLQGAQGETLLQLQWGTLRKVKINGESVSVFDAKSSKSKEPFTLLESDVNAWKLDELMGAPVAQKKEATKK